MPASQTLLLGLLRRGLSVKKGHQLRGAPGGGGGGGGGAGGGGRLPAARKRGGLAGAGANCAPIPWRGGWPPGRPRAAGPREGRSTRRRTSGHRAVARTCPSSGRVAHQTFEDRGRRACTAVPTSSPVAVGVRGGGGGLAGVVVVPRPAPPVHRHGVQPAGGRLSLEEGEAVEREEVPVGGGVVPAHHWAVPGQPPQRRAGLLVPYGCQVLAPCIGEAGTLDVRLGGTREEDPGVSPLQGLGHSGPLGPELRAIGDLDGGNQKRAAPTRVVGVPPSVPGPGKEVLDVHAPMA